jgi:hypothetical protein
MYIYIYIYNDQSLCLQNISEDQKDQKWKLIASTKRYHDINDVHDSILKS